MCEIIDVKHCKTLCTSAYYHTVRLFEEKSFRRTESFTFLHFVELFSHPTMKDIVVEEGLI